MKKSLSDAIDTLSDFHLADPRKEGDPKADQATQVMISTQRSIDDYRD